MTTIGIDVGKTEHHVTVTGNDGARLYAGYVPNHRDQLCELFGSWPTATVVIDQKGSLATQVRSAAGHLALPVRYVSGLTMRRAAQLTPGDAKTDARDSEVIALVGRLLPQRTAALAAVDEVSDRIRLLSAHDTDLAGERTRVSNRLRDLLVSVDPTLEAFVGPDLSRAGILALLAAFPDPAALHHADPRTVRARLKGQRQIDSLVERWKAWRAHSSGEFGPGVSSASWVIADLVEDLIRIDARRRRIKAKLTELAAQHPYAAALENTAGIGPATLAALITHVPDITAFPSADHLASYAGVAPLVTQSGTSRVTSRPRSGNKSLKRAMFLSAFAACRTNGGIDRAYYDKKRAEGKRHNQAVMALARKRITAIYNTLTLLAKT